MDLKGLNHCLQLFNHGHKEFKVAFDKHMFYLMLSCFP